MLPEIGEDVRERMKSHVPSRPSAEELEEIIRDIDRPTEKTELELELEDPQMNVPTSISKLDTEVDLKPQGSLYPPVRIDPKEELIPTAIIPKE